MDTILEKEAKAILKTMNQPPVVVAFATDNKNATHSLFIGLHQNMMFVVRPILEFLGYETKYVIDNPIKHPDKKKDKKKEKGRASGGKDEVKK
jgi:hypothetical protein